jgi:hypothetical protein
MVLSTPFHCFRCSTTTTTYPTFSPTMLALLSSHTRHRPATATCSSSSSSRSRSKAEFSQRQVDGGDDGRAGLGRGRGKKRVKGEWGVCRVSSGLSHLEEDESWSVRKEP